MVIQEFVYRILQFMNVCIVYCVVQIVRCALLSYAVFAFICLVRKTVFKNRVFLKGALWSLMIPVLFAGRMKFFYESENNRPLFWRWTSIGMNHSWVCWLYLCGIFVYAFLLLHKRIRLEKMVAGMKKGKVGGTLIYVTELPVTPFTVGVLRPRIVMPEIILKDYSKEESDLILLHEKTHIRLGHLLFYLLWDILCALFWINPLLTKGAEFFREDLEEICDWVTIKRSGKKAYAYGQLLVKCMRILQMESEEFNLYAAFAEDKEFGYVRQRVKRIAGYKPYRRIMAAAVAAAAVLGVAGTGVWLNSVSYDRYNESDAMLVYGYDGKNVTFFDNSDTLCQMISHDDSYVYVNREAFESFLGKNKAKGDIFIVFGGFYKLPGFGGGAASCIYETDSREEVVKIPYERPAEDWMMTLFKIL